MRPKVNTELVQGSQKNSNPKYENSEEFRQNFFRFNTTFQRHDNYQQLIQIIDFSNKEFGEKGCYIKDTQTKQDKIINYIIEYQQQYNISQKQIYQLRRSYVDLEKTEVNKEAKDDDKKNKKVVSGAKQVDFGTKEVQIEQNGVDRTKVDKTNLLVYNNFKNCLTEIFNSFYEGDNSQIILQHISNEPNLLRQLISQAIKEFNETKKKDEQSETNEDLKKNEEVKKKINNLKITYIGITQEYHIPDVFQDFETNSLQNFSIMLQDSQSFNYKLKQDLKSLVLQDQYYMKLNLGNKKITNEILHLYRYFLKMKIRKYQPKLIVLLIEINDSFDFETYFFQKLISQLEKISQNCLIIIPILTSYTSESFEKYLKQTLLISNSYFDYKFKRKNKTHYQCEDISAQKYKEYSTYFSQTQKEEQFFLRQYLALKVRQNFFQQNEQMEIEYQKQMLPTELSTQVIEAQDSNQTQDLEYNLFGILNSRNQIELTKLYERYSKQPIRIFEVEHFIYYNQDNKSFIICIVKDDKLFYQYKAYKIDQEKQIEDSIYLEEYKYFEKFNKGLKSSYLLQGDYFCQFNVSFQKVVSNLKERKRTSGFKYYVQYKKYNLRYEKAPDFYHNIENQKDGLDQLTNFTISPIKDNQFILIGGTYESYIPQKEHEQQSRQSEYEFNLGAYAVTVEIDENQKNKLKVTENIGKLKCYENCLTQKINDQSFLYFEGQTKYQAGQFQSQIQRMSIFGYEQNLQFDNCKIQNQNQFDFYQKKKKLFRSNQLNKKIIEQSKKKIDFIVVVQELIYDKVKIVDEEDSINLKQLSKQVQLQAHKFRFTYDPAKQVIEDNKTKQILDIQEESFYFVIEQVEKSNSLRNACLYANWLEDRNNQYIFHYNGVQNLYLLYFQEKPKPKTRKFIFEDQQDKEDNLDFDEVILNDLENEQLWIVRKINHQDKIYLDLYERQKLNPYNSAWINLQDVKDSTEDAITKVPMNQIFRIAELKEDFCLIGLEVKWQNEQGQRCPYLVVCTSTTIYEISIKQIRKTKWDYILRYKFNSWEKEPLQFQQSPITRSKQVSFQVNMQIPTIVANLQNGDLLLFYSYCNVKSESNNKYQLEIKYLILKDCNQKSDEMEAEESNREFQFKSIEYNSRKQVNLAKVNTVIINNDEFQFSIIVEESDGCLYKVFSGDGEKKQYITLIRESKILSNAAFLKNQSIIIGKNKETVVHLE
ncbi:unnamed protein product (macronuclear) [Paramecium tetraurelia]|uniref:Uncharacterized protein n=1 Tax=Paramecium tetraurelia TaxID=5888 RepID=A0BJ10_PARTE|nr:uncharacterized protein GSPATT00004900001 [Paramecium tetraurelia]CAK58527.1 unnamed protein product [Paramecium tetraurelia]|eukprot:XP_001425925.1 hypothetical protein (macronuclear) [Paramecium tetraurelia strain d4-2]